MPPKPAALPAVHAAGDATRRLRRAFRDGRVVRAGTLDRLLESP